MSDKPEGPGWWIASDGKWYAPELHPSVRDDAAPRAKAPTADPAQPQRWQGQAEKATTQVGPRFPDLFQKALQGSHLADNISVKYDADDPRNGSLASTRPAATRPTAGSSSGGSSGPNKRKWRKGH
jgi:hypothetical protein